MLYKIARGLQLVGMAVVPIGIMGNIADPERVPLKNSLMIAGVGAAIFLVGWLLQESARPQ
jgi:hypothetical protein